MTNVMYVCATCGSPAVDFSALAGGNANCRACGWAGTREDLIGVPVRQEGLADADQTLLAMYNDLRHIFRDNAGAFITFFVRWGFLDARNRAGKIELVDPKLAVRFINAVFLGALKGILETKDQLEKERVRVKPD